MAVSEQQSSSAINKAVMRRDLAFRFLFLGFILLLGSGGSWLLLHDARQHIDTLQQARQQRQQQFERMYRAARDAVVQQMMMEKFDDPFDIVARQDQALAYMGEFAFAWHRLEEHLDTANLPAFRLLQKKHKQVRQQVERYWDFLLADKRMDASFILKNEILPAHNNLIHLLEDFQVAEKIYSEEKLQQTEQRYTVRVNWAIALVLLCVAVSFWLLVDTLRRLFQHRHALLAPKGDAVITTDALFRINYLNGTAEMLTGWQLKQLQRQPVTSLFHFLPNTDVATIEGKIRSALENNKVISLSEHIELRRADGRALAIDSTIAPLRDNLGQGNGLILVFHEKDAHPPVLTRQLSWQARHDSLTGLVNRREFEHYLNQAVDCAVRQGRIHALAYVDLDQFKLVNDSCGHGAGDELLRNTSQLLLQSAGETDIVARLGGDEFGILLQDCPLAEARERVEQLRQRIHDTRFEHQGKCFDISVSIGLVEVNQQTRDAAGALGAADIACYTAKDEGRNRVLPVMPDAASLERRQQETQWATRITAAMEEGRLQLYSQCIVSLAPRHSGVCHYELLLRMYEHDGHLVPPGIFLPAAERYNLMSRIDRWVIHHAFRQMGAEKTKQHYALNLSGQSFSDVRFLDFVLEQIHNHQVDPNYLCFEITETAAVGNLTQAIEFIQVLRSKGCRFSLDDFGTGLSSYAYLKTLQVDFLKIDGSFVRDIAHDPINHAMVESINTIAHTMGLQTIAEYVEDQEVLHCLQELGVDYGQGYFIGRPEPWLNI